MKSPEISGENDGSLTQKTDVGLKTESGKVAGHGSDVVTEVLNCYLKLLFFFKKVVIPINIFSSIKFFKTRNIITTVISVNSPLV